MEFSWYFLLGVLVALGSGIFNNIGNLLQKKAVNEYLKTKIREINNAGGDISLPKYSGIDLSMKTLIRQKTWIIGFGLQLVLGSGFFIWGQVIIGPTLTPAIGSFGLIVLVFATTMVQEKLTLDEYFGIIIMIIAVFLLGFSDLVIDATNTDFLQLNFLVRVVIFSGVIATLSLFCKLWANRKDKFEGSMLASVSGMMVALSNFWISPATSIGLGLFSPQQHQSLTFKDHSLWGAVLLFMISFFILVFANIYAVYVRQLAFRVGHAATMIPISHVPSHLSSPIIYTLVFWLPQPKAYSLAFMWIGIILLLISSFIFGKREAYLEQKQHVGEDAVPLV